MKRYILFDHDGVLVDTGTVVLAGTELVRSELGYLGTGRSVLSISNRTAATARILIIGGPPFDEDILMWWNFVGRDHDDIVRAREDWETEGQERFGTVPGHGAERIPAPPLPGVRLTPRRRPAAGPVRDVGGEHGAPAPAMS